MEVLHAVVCTELIDPNVGVLLGQNTRISNESGRVGFEQERILVLLSPTKHYHSQCSAHLICIRIPAAL